MTEISLPDLEGIFRKASAVIDKEMAVVVKATARKVAQTQREQVPVRTGRTKKSIVATGPNGAAFNATTIEAEIGPTWFVGRFIELGGAYTAPYVYVADSIDPHMPDFLDEIGKAATEGALKGLFG